jgi:hypothetical protein
MFGFPVIFSFTFSLTLRFRLSTVVAVQVRLSSRRLIFLIFFLD